MTLQQLTYFIAVAETGNFTKAAQQMYSTQPTISRQIQLLEDELGYELFIRKSKPIKMTDSGRILYNGVKNVMGDIKYALDMAKIASEGKRGSLSISFQAGYYAETMFFPVLNELRQELPALKVQCTKLFSWDQIKGLKNESIDIAIGLNFPHWEENGFKVRKLSEVETLIVMSSQHRLAGKETIEYDDLYGETFYLTAPNGYQIDKILKNRFNLNGVHQEEVPSSEVAYFKVLSDNGLTISNPFDPNILNNPMYSYKKFEPNYKDYYVLVTNPENKNPVVQHFIDLIENDTFKN